MSEELTDRTEWPGGRQDVVELVRAAMSGDDNAVDEVGDIEDAVELLCSEIDRLRAEVERLRAELQEAGDGDTWREACGRCEAEIERLRAELDERGRTIGKLMLQFENDRLKTDQCDLRSQWLTER